MPSAQRSAHASAPLAALGLVLVLLSLAGLANGAPRAAPPVPAAADAGPPPTQVRRLLADAPLDLNRATRADLQLLPRIGPTLASRIVEDRETRGCFDDPSELTRVRGIGEATLERLAPLLTVTSTPALCRPP